MHNRQSAIGNRLSARGFTLIEMVVVISIIGLISAVVLPQLIPALVQGRLEGAARHLAGYGMSAMAHCALMRETITVKFDLKKQQYWAIRTAKVSPSIFDEKGDAKEGKAEEKKDRTSGEDLDLMHTSKKTGEETSADDMASQADALRERFKEFARMQLMSQARQVENKGILDEVGPLFDKPFALEDEKETEEEIMDPLLERTALPEGVVIESVHVGSDSYSSGEAHIELSPLGLYESVVIYVKNEDGEYFTIIWDPITGGARIEEGKKTPPDETDKGMKI